MNDFECMRSEALSSTNDHYLKNLMKEMNLEIKFLSENEEISKSSKPLILAIDADSIKKILIKLDGREEKIIFALNSRKDFKLLSELKPVLNRVFGFIDLSQEIEYNLPLVKNYLNLNFSKNTLGLEKLASDLEKVFEFTKSELVKIKSLHDRFVKIRTDKFKGITLSSKFMAGEKSGGEFFEVVQNESGILYVQVGCNSYIASSMILSEIELLKDRAVTASLGTISNQFAKTLKLIAAEQNASVSSLVIHFDSKTLTANLNPIGDHIVYYQNELLDIVEPITFKLKPRERLNIISIGALKNWEALSKLPLSEFFQEHHEKNTKDLINEFFFEVSRNKVGNFLIFDALMMVFEIEDNVLYQLS